MQRTNVTRCNGELVSLEDEMSNMGRLCNSSSNSSIGTVNVPFGAF